MPKTEQELKAARRQRRADAKKMGRPAGASTKPKERRTLTPVQKLREHVLIELGLDKKDIADAIGEKRQTVSHIFLDVHRSEAEAKVVALLRERYDASGADTQEVIDMLIGHDTVWTDGISITREAMGWPEKAAGVVSHAEHGGSGRGTDEGP